MENLQTRYQNLLNRCEGITRIRSFFQSRYFPFVVALTMIVSDFFALELICYTLVALLGIVTLLTDPDTKPLLCIVLLYQMGMSYPNGLSYNKYPDRPNIYDRQEVVVYFGILIAALALAAILNGILFRQYKRFFSKSRFLLPSLIPLSIAYLTGGIGSSGYTFDNLLFSLSNAAMILGIFIYFSDTAFLTGDPLKEISALLLAVAFTIVSEVIFIYFDNRIIRDGIIYKFDIRNGWGIHNNFAGLLCICVPFLSYAAIKESSRNTRLIYAFGLLYACAGILLTLSRNGILLMAILLTGAFIVLIKSAHPRKPLVFDVLLTSLALIVLLVALFCDEIQKLLTVLLESGFGLNGREELYRQGIGHFLSNPIFGVGWFKCNPDTSSIPPNSFAPAFKYHNIAVQLLASCGIVGLFGWLFFFVYATDQTFKNRTACAKICYLGILALLLGSIFDNFFFDYTFERFLALFLTGIAVSSPPVKVPNREQSRKKSKEEQTTAYGKSVCYKAQDIV